ncbi:hypothetical protein CDL12_00749 [Handroanthus impetiginosus]|uniref:NAC domain-containing protein n=1 Tax=Handroanthus impetiginosus TaxID=429701 RepID=A0A2G9I9R7_9LAMI|nr:hypothetical protein CDL12_00749 [Handroanthus impetiginosus]
MSSLSSVEAKLPPGFRFHPKDEELICDYLMKRIAGCAHLFPLLIEVDLNKVEPWDIPETACVGSKEWYFYSQRDRKYATGLRTNRATVSGYWKATGKDRPVIQKGSLVGMRKTLVFYQGRAPKGRKTDWVMHEFRLEGPGPKVASLGKEDWVLCRVFFKSRSENPDTSQETANYNNGTTCFSSPLPPLTEPYITFDDTQAVPNNQYNEQVPCFSIFAASQTSPNFSVVAHTDPPARIMPNFGGIMSDFGSYNYSSSLMNDPSSCDKKVITAVLNHLTKVESGNDPLISMRSSSSFGEGSSDSYLSEVGLSCLWNNQYQ